MTVIIIPIVPQKGYPFKSSHILNVIFHQTLYHIHGMHIDNNQSIHGSHQLFRQLGSHYFHQLLKLRVTLVQVTFHCPFSSLNGLLYFVCPMNLASVQHTLTFMDTDPILSSHVFIGLHTLFQLVSY